jgi:hypothetical protein
MMKGTDFWHLDDLAHLSALDVTRLRALSPENSIWALNHREVRVNSTL